MRSFSTSSSDVEKVLSNAAGAPGSSLLHTRVASGEFRLLFVRKLGDWRR